jgi:hypothetical protein
MPAAVYSPTPSTSVATGMLSDILRSTYLKMVYDASVAHGVFPFISPKWVPGDLGSRDATLMDLESGGIQPQTSKQICETVDVQKKVVVICL